MKKKKFLSLLVILVMLFSYVPQDVIATNGPCPNEWPPAYICLTNHNSVSYIFSAVDNDITEINGVSYNKATNILTLNNVKLAEYSLTTNVMGDDFKINVVGSNELKSISVWGDGYGGNLTVSGNGTLTINKSKSSECSIRIFAEGTKGQVRIEKSVNLNLYAQDKYPVIASTGSLNTATDSAIIIEGTPSCNIAVTKNIEKNTYQAKKLAFDISRRCQLAKYEKNGHYYGGNRIYDDNGQITDNYNIYELIYDETYGYVAMAVENHTNINPLDYGYTVVLEDGVEASFDDVLMLDSSMSWATYVPLYHNNTDNKDYGILSVNYGSETEYTIYTFEEHPEFGTLAVPVNSEPLNAIPSNYEPITNTSYSYGYMINVTELMIKSASNNQPSVHPTTKAYKKPARVVRLKVVNKRKKVVSLVWAKAKYAKKYQIQYSTSKKFSKAKKYKTRTITTGKTKYKIKKLTKKKVYYFRVRGINTKKVGRWSKVKKIKIVR